MIHQKGLVFLIRKCTNRGPHDLGYCIKQLGGLALRRLEPEVEAVRREQNEEKR